MHQRSYFYVFTLTFDHALLQDLEKYVEIFTILSFPIVFGPLRGVNTQVTSLIPIRRSIDLTVRAASDESRFDPVGDPVFVSC